MFLPDGKTRILSRALRLRWAGWETNTVELQRNGWQLSVEQDVNRDRMRIALMHADMRMLAITDRFPFDYKAAAFDQVRDGYLDRMVAPVVRAIAQEMFVEKGGYTTDPISFHAIDALPTIVQSVITKLEDLAHFATPLVRTQQIIIPEDTVPDLLAKILKLQQPSRIERIKDDIAGYEIGAEPQRKFHAQILSFARGA